jgi:acetyl esterase/lipase
MANGPSSRRVAPARRLRPFSRRSLWWAASAANGAWPRRHNRVLSIPSFFWAWITTELAGPLLAWNVVATLRATRRGKASGADGAVAVAARAFAAAGLARFVLEGMRADEEFVAALSPHIPAKELQSRPRSVRAGAWLPILYGGRGRRVRERNVVFTPPDSPYELALDVYQPIEATPGQRRPAIIQIHGGAWVIGDKREQGIPLLNHLANLGWVGFNVNYRKSPRVKAPGHLIDCKAAIAWVRANADRYGVDPDFIAVTGGSAGGHLCALVALTANDPEYQPGFEEIDTTVQAAVPFYGVYDLSDVDGHMVTGFKELFIEPMVMGSKHSADAAPFERYSPMSRVRADAPPMLIIHGSNDALVPVETARAFAAKMAGTSDSAVIYAELHGAQHAFDIFPSPRTVRTIEYVERFLDATRRGAIK